VGKVNKLHRRLVKKRGEISTHKKAVRALLTIVSAYADNRNWKATDNTRDVMEKGIVIGVQRTMEWVGVGTGPDLAETIMKGVKNG